MSERAAHALVAWIEGVELHEVRLWPGYDRELGFYFGYVARGDGGSLWIDAAVHAAYTLSIGACVAAPAWIRSRSASPSG